MGTPHIDTPTTPQGATPKGTPLFLVDGNNWFLIESLRSILEHRALVSMKMSEPTSSELEPATDSIDGASTLDPASTLDATSARGPYVIVGPPSSGKTTLIHAIAAAWQELASATSNGSTPKPIVTTGADFARTYAHAVEADALDDFRRRHRRAGLVVIDGLQGLANKPAAQQELRTILDRLAPSGTIVVCTSTTAPLRDAGLSPDLASRLAGGQVVPIAPTTDSVSVALAKHHVAQTDLSLDESGLAELLKFVQRKPKLTPLAIRNAVGELALKASQINRPYSAADVRAHFEDKVIPAITPKEIALAVGKWMNIRWDDLKGPSREQSIVRARGLAMWLIRELTGQSLSAIGALFADRDHTTVMNACQRIARLLETDTALQSARASLLDQLSNASTSMPVAGASRSKPTVKPNGGKPKVRVSAAGE